MTNALNTLKYDEYSLKQKKYKNDRQHTVKLKQACALTPDFGVTLMTTEQSPVATICAWPSVEGSILR